MRCSAAPASRHASFGAGCLPSFLLQLSLLVCVFGCARENAGESSDAPVEGPLYIVSPHWEGLRTEYTRAFNRWHAERFGSRVDVNWIDLGGTSNCLRYILDRFGRTPEGIGADVFFGGGTDPYLTLSDRDFLEPYQIPAQSLSRIPPDLGGVPLYDAEYRWYGTALSGFGILYNRVALDWMGLPEVHTWEDLADPRLRGWLGIADPRSSGSVHMLYEIILQGDGWEKGFDIIMRIGGNTRTFYHGSSQVPRETAYGEIAYCLTIDIYAWPIVAEVGKEKMAFVLPEGKTVINPDGIAILKGAPNRARAERFVEFVLSETGQQLLLEPTGSPFGPKEFNIQRLSVMPHLYDTAEGVVTLNPFQEISGFSYNSSLGTRRWSILNDLIAAVIIDPHRELTACWKAIGEAGSPEELISELGRPPVTEEELLTLAETEWNNPAKRAAVIQEWVETSLAKYRRLRSTAESYAQTATGA